MKRQILDGIVILSLFGFLLFSCAGCKTTNQTTQQRVITAAKLAAYVGTAEYVLQHPDSKPKFVLAANQLTVIAAQDHVDLVALLAIVNQLPVKELKSDQARIIITVSTLLLSDYAGSLPVDKLDNLKPVAKAIADGINLGLGTP